MAEMFGNVAASHGALSEGGTASAGMSFPIIVHSDTGPPASFPLSPVFLCQVGMWSSHLLAEK
jgi:hypothetical protein